MNTESPTIRANKEAFSTALWNHYRSFIYFAQRFMPDEQDAKDLVSMAYEKALRNWDKFELGTNIEAWTRTIIRNTFITQFYRKQKIRKAEEMAYPNEEEQEDTGGEDIEYQFEGQEDASGRLEKIRARINTALRKYSGKTGEKHIKLALLHIEEGYTYEEIAEMMEVPVNSIKVYIHKGRKILKEELAEFRP